MRLPTSGGFIIHSDHSIKNLHSKMGVEAIETDPQQNNTAGRETQCGTAGLLPAALCAFHFPVAKVTLAALRFHPSHSHNARPAETSRTKNRSREQVAGDSLGFLYKMTRVNSKGRHRDNFGFHCKPCSSIAKRQPQAVSIFGHSTEGESRGALTSKVKRFRFR